MSKFFTTEQISKYHPDKYADQISDAIVTEALKQDRNSRLGVETLVKDHTVVLGGEIKSLAHVSYDKVVHQVATDLGYRVDNIINLIGRQSPEINKAVDAKVLTAGDQGLMFGYANSETESYLPFGFDLANRIIKRIEADVNVSNIFKGDAKTQVSTKENGDVDLILISACHHDNITLTQLDAHLKDMFPEYADRLIVNPAGIWTMGGANADCGVTGRKIVCDQYGGFCAVGGGAFSGKDPSKVDRTASYMARYIAVSLLKVYGGKEATVQLGYGIGLENPLFVSAEMDGLNMTKKAIENYPLTPTDMINFLGLYDVDYYKLSGGCHYYSNSGLSFK